MPAIWLLGTACLSSPPPGLPDPATFLPPSVDTADESALAEAEEAPRAGNRPPRIQRLVVLPQEPRTTDDLRADARVVDPDGDPLSLDFEWEVNGRPLLEATGRVLPSRLTRKGQVVRVHLVASDGHHEVERLGEPIRIRNSPPRIEHGGRPISRLDGTRVRAVDPDGDPLTFRLENAPPGLDIDRRTGEIHFTPPTDLREPRTWQVRVIAEDPEGEQSVWEFGVTLTPGGPSSAG